MTEDVSVDVPIMHLFCVCLQHIAYNSHIAKNLRFAANLCIAYPANMQMSYYKLHHAQDNANQNISQVQTHHYLSFVNIYNTTTQ